MISILLGSIIRAVLVSFESSLFFVIVPADTPVSLRHATDFVLQIFGSTCLSVSQLKRHWATQLPGVVRTPEVQMGLQATLHRRWGSVSAPFLHRASQVLWPANLLI